MRLWALCGALAAGEYAASFAPELAPMWPVPAIGATLVALFGFGLGAKGWGYAFAVPFGIAIFLFASRGDAQRYLESPWMRGRDWHYRQRQEEQTGTAKAVKDDLSRRVGIGLDDDREAVALSRAILLGERRRLPRRTKKLFVESGTMHVFAISGLHVMAIAKVLAVVLGLFMVPLRLAGLLSVPLLWGYVMLIGSAPSAVRAAMMATIMEAAPVFWRRANSLRAWELTFLVVHVCDPLLISNVGNALSFAVMLAIVVAGDIAKSMPEWRKSLLVTLVAWAAGVPISAHVFGRVTPGGMVANLVLIATAKATVVAGALGVGVSYLSRAVAAHVNNFCALGIKSMVLVSEAVSRLPGANFETAPWSVLTCVEWYAVLALVGFLMYRAAKRRQAL